MPASATTTANALAPRMRSPAAARPPSLGFWPQLCAKPVVWQSGLEPVPELPPPAAWPLVPGPSEPPPGTVLAVVLGLAGMPASMSSPEPRKDLRTVGLSPSTTEALSAATLLYQYDLPLLVPGGDLAL